MANNSNPQKKKADKRKTAVRITCLILAGLLFLGSCTLLITLLIQNLAH